MKKEVNFNKISKKDLIELYRKKCEEFDQLEAKFRKLQEEHNQTILELQNVVEKDKLKAQRLFGKKTEKSSCLENKEEEFNIAERQSSQNKKGRKKGSKNFDKEYLESHVSSTEYIEPNEYENLKNDPNVVLVGEDVSYKVSYEPATFKVTKIICRKYLNKETKKFYQGVKENDPFPHSICTADLVTNTMINKFMYGIPYYRQSDVMINDGLNFSRQDLCNFQIRATEILKPMYDYLKKKLLNTSSNVICADETTLRVLENKKANSYVWVYISDFYNYPIYIYEYCKNRSKENVKKFLGDYNGYLLTDAYTGYENIDGIKNAFCRAHARRKFAEIEKTLSEEQKKESVAVRIRKKIDKLFFEENKFKESKFGPEKIFSERNTEKYLSLVDDIFSELESIEPSEGSALKRAFDYILNRKEGFLTFLKDGHIELSNNISERAIKPFVIDRKNFLFSNTENGADSSLIFFSLQQTARANGVNPIKYISELINKLGTTINIDDNLLEDLLPRKSNFSVFNAK